MKNFLLSFALLLFFTVETNAQLIANAGADQAACPGTTVVLGGSPTATGGSGPYTYSWTPSIGLSNANIANPLAVLTTTTITYQVIVTDNLGSVDSDMVTISLLNPPVATHVTTNVTCAGGNNGFVQVVVTGGVPPYSYAWSNGSTVQNMGNLPAGTYSVTITDQNGCTTGLNASIFEPTPLVAVAQASPETLPGACNGGVILSANGGTTPYTYTWAPGGFFGPVINSLCPGQYTVTVTDANGCNTTATAFVAAACPVNTLVVSVSSHDIDCVNTADTLVANVSGGTPPYYYWWTNSSSDQSIVVSQPGVYSLWVTDSAGCSQSVQDTVLNLGLQISLLQATPVSCNGINDGSISVSVAGGTGAYTYLWSNGATSSSITGLAAGTYTLSVQDAALCNAIFTYTVPQSSTNWSYYIYTTTSQANCVNNGISTAQVYGGTAPFSFLWSNTDTTQTIFNLAPGSYSVTVTGADGCVRTANAFVQTSCHNIISGRLIRDLNGNCLLDVGETPFANQLVIADGNTDYYDYTDAQGYFSIPVLSGTYQVRPMNTGACLAACSGGNNSYTLNFPGLGDTSSNNDFYLVPAPFNLFTTNSWTGFRPGFTQTIYVYYGNVGVDTVNATLTFTYDSDLNFVSAGNGGVHNATNHTITWNLPNLLPSTYYYYYTNYVTASFLTPIGTPVGTPIINHTAISTLPSECDTTDNHYTVSAVVTNSFDPNEKEVSPAGNIFDETDSILTYTIHFQNSGNDTAWFVILRDTLSPHLQPGSVRNVASSHPITEFKIEGEGRLTWIFNPIYLVDSATNEEASKGYVSFEVKKKSGLPIGTQIKNTASIYFDYNEPVVTNTVSTLVADPNSIFSVTSEASIHVSAAPNPFTQKTQINVEGVNTAYRFDLYDVSGKILQSFPALNEKQFTLQRNGISAGVYFYSITTTGKQTAHGRLVVQ